MNDFWEPRSTSPRSNGMTPRRPTSNRRRRPFGDLRIPALRWTRATIGVMAAISVGVIALSAGFFAPDDGSAVQSASGRAAEPAKPTGPTDLHLTQAWRADVAPDPIEMLVTRKDTLVVTATSILSYATKDGVKRWEVEVKDPEPYLAVDADTVLLSQTKAFEARDRRTGASRWRLPLADSTDQARTVALVGTEVGPIAVGTTERGGVVGIDASSGAVRWSIAVDGRPRTRLAVARALGLVVLVSVRGDQNDLRVLDAATGAVRWSRVLPPGTGVPLVAGHRLIFGTGEFSGTGTVFAVRVGDGSPLWDVSMRTSFEAGEEPTVASGVVYLVDRWGMVHARDVETGALEWKHELEGMVLFGRPVVVGELVALHDANGEVYLLDRRTGRERAGAWFEGVPMHFGAGGDRLVFGYSQVSRWQVSAFFQRHLPRDKTAKAFGQPGL